MNAQSLRQKWNIPSTLRANLQVGDCHGYRNTIIASALLPVFLLSAGSTAWAAAIQFDNGCFDGNWHTCCSIGGGNFDNNWNTGTGMVCPALPGPNDDVDLLGHTVLLNQAPEQINSIVSTGIFTIGGVDLSVTQGAVLSEFNLAGGGLHTGAAVTVNGPLTWTSGTLGHLGGPPVMTQLLGGLDISFVGANFSGRTVVSTDDTLWTNGNLSLNAESSFDNQATFTIECDKFVQGNDGTLINSGSLIKKTTAGQTRVLFGVDFESAGQVDVQTGTLLLEGSGFSSGPFSIAADALLRIAPSASATFTLQDGTSFTGAGLGQGFVRFTGNKCFIPAGVGIPATNFEVASGTLTGPGSLTAQLFKWTGGAIDGSDVSALQVLDIDGFLSKTLSASGVGPAMLTNVFGATWKGTGDIILSTVGGTTNGVTLVNEQDALFDIKSNETLSGTGTFVNYGIVQKSEGTQATIFDGIFYQNGATAGGRGAGGAVKTDVQTGTLLIGGSGENAVDATFDVDSNATLTFRPQGNDTFVMRGDGDTVTGDGQVIKTGSGDLNIPDMNHFGLKNLQMIAGKLSGPGRFTAENLLWNGGTLLNLGPVANPGDPQNPFRSTATQSLTINSTVTLENSELVSDGNGLWTGTGFFTFNDGVFVNRGTLLAQDAHPTINLRALFSSGASFFENNGSMSCTGDGVEFSVINGSGTFINNNTLNNTAGAINFGPGVALDNNGTIDVQAGDLIIRGGGTNTGTFNVSGGEMYFRANAYTLANGTLILGPGPAIIENVVRILGLVHADVVEIFSTGGIIEDLGRIDIAQSMIWAAGTMRHAGTTTILPGATLSIQGSAQKNLEQRLLDVQGAAFLGGTGHLELNSGANLLVTGELIADTDGEVRSFGPVPKGTVTIGAAGVFTVQSPQLLFNSAILKNGGTVNVEDTGWLILFSGGGDFTNGHFNLADNPGQTNELSLEQIKTWIFNNTDVFGPGALRVNANATMNVTGNSRVDNLEVGANIDGPADLLVIQSLTFPAFGVLKGTGSVTATGTMTIGSVSIDARTLHNNAIGVWDSGGVSITGLGGAVFNNINSLEMTNNGTFAVGLGGATINNRGQFIKTGTVAGVTTIAPTFNHISGKVQAQLGDLCFTGAFNQTGGIIQTNLSGNLSFTGPGGLNKTGGQIRGTGTIVGTVNLNGGVMNPGDSPGTLTIDGDLTIASNGLIDIELAGLDPGNEHDVVDVTGTAALSGTLRLLPINGYIPQIGDSFIVLTADNVTGMFDAVTGPGAYTIDYNSDNVVATVTSAPACADLSNADLNFDCAVNLLDHEILSGCHGGPLNATPPAGCSHAEFATSDLDFDGDVDAVDFAEFQLQFAAP